MLKDLFHRVEKRLRRTKYKNEALEKKVELLNRQVQTFENDKIKAVQQITEMTNRISETTNQLKDYHQVVENLRNHNALLEGYPKVLENIRNNNILITRLQDDADAVSLKLNKVLNNSKTYKDVQCQERAGEDKGPDMQKALHKDTYMQVDYFDFENHFRGNREDIKKSQSQYLKYFEQCEKVLDIGCGRGEFLELLKENNIGALGVDLYEDYAEYCRLKGFDAVCDDCLHFLRTSDPVDGIFVGQVVEHLEAGQIMELCVQAYEKLVKGSYIIMETPNPTSLAIYTHAFYIDPSHIKPVHPLTLQYYLEKAGFKDIQILFTENSKLDIKIPDIQLNDPKTAQDFNNAMKIVSNTLFGSQDYAVIAKR